MSTLGDTDREGNEELTNGQSDKRRLENDYFKSFFDPKRVLEMTRMSLVVV